MIIGESFNYRFVFEKVKERGEEIKNENYFDTRKIGGSLYSIFLEDKWKFKKNALEQFLDRVTPLLEDLMKRDKRFSNRIAFNYRGQRTIDYSYN